MNVFVKESVANLNVIIKELLKLPLNLLKVSDNADIDNADSEKL